MKSYLITDPFYYNSSFANFSLYLHDIYKRYHVDYVCFRDKENSKDLERFAKEFLKISQHHNIKKTLINTHIDLAIKLGFWGVHLNSRQLYMIPYAKKSNLFVIISTHSIEEALKAEQKGADAITFSPIFKTPNKPNPKGIKALKELSQVLNINCFALGGVVSQKEIDKCKKANIYGFASIRYFCDTIKDKKINK